MTIWPIFVSKCPTDDELSSAGDHSTEDEQFIDDDSTKEYLTTPSLSETYSEDAPTPPETVPEVGFVSSKTVPKSGL